MLFSTVGVNRYLYYEAVCILSQYVRTYVCIRTYVCMHAFVYEVLFVDIIGKFRVFNYSQYIVV